MPSDKRDKRKVYVLDDDNKISSSKKLKSSNNMFSKLFNFISCDSSTSFYSRRNKDSESNFSQKKCLALFNDYASKEDKNVIGPEGIQKFCYDLNVNIEDPVMLVIAWKMDAKQMCIFTLKEFTKGLSELQCDSISKLKAKLDYLRQLLLDPVSFKQIYRYTFGFSKESSNQKALDINIAKTLLKILLYDLHKWQLFEYFNEFLDQSNYNYINSDQWINILEFSKVILPDLSNYDENSAWPIMLDEFCAWYKANVLDKKQ